MSNLYNREQLRSHEYMRMRKELGGGYSLIDAVLSGSIGSPLLQYVSGHDTISALDARCSDQLRINMELLKSGIFIWIAERTRSYFLALPYGSFFIEPIHNTSTDIHTCIHLADGQRLILKTRYQHKKAWEKFVKRVNESRLEKH